MGTNSLTNEQILHMRKVFETEYAAANPTIVAPCELAKKGATDDRPYKYQHANDLFALCRKMFSAGIAEAQETPGGPIYQYRIRNAYNGQVTEWQTIRRDQVDFVLKAQPLSAEFQIISTPQQTSEREQVRREHAAWSLATFGEVGPIGPLKHLSKEALEAAAEPGDLSEWADMQFLLWDAQRRAGISDGEITAAMEEKLKVNMARQWPEPKDGEPRLHIKAVSQPVPENNDRQTLRCLAVILAGNDAPGEIMALTVTAQSFVDRCKALVAERDELRKIVSAAKGDECTS